MDWLTPLLALLVAALVVALVRSAYRLGKRDALQHPFDCWDDDEAQAEAQLFRIRRRMRVVSDLAEIALTHPEHTDTVTRAIDELYESPSVLEPHVVGLVQRLIAYDGIDPARLRRIMQDAITRTPAAAPVQHAG